jgi:hypothetical protein
MLNTRPVNGFVLFTPFVQQRNLIHTFHISSRFLFCPTAQLMVSGSFVVRDGQHLEEKTQVLDVVGAVIVVDGEPEHSV